MRYGIQFDFDVHGEAPKVYIAENEGHGTAVLEVFEEPRCLRDEWTNDDDAWEAGAMALRVLAALNAT